MNPNEFEAHYRQQSFQRDAENYRLVKSLRTEPTLWQRVRARLNIQPADSFAAHSEQALPCRDIIATSR